MAGTNSLIVGGSAGNNGLTACFLPVAGHGYAGVTTESNYNSKFQSSATFSNLGINAKSQIDTATFTFRTGGSNGNQTVTIASGFDSFASDSTHSDSITAGNAVDIAFGNTGDVVTPRCSNMQCNAASLLVWYGLGYGGAAAKTLSSTTYYANIQGATSQSATYSQTWSDATKSNLRAAGTLSNLGMMIVSGSTGTVSVGSYIAGSAGNQALSFTTSTGWVQDTTHTDAVAANTDCGTTYSSSNSTGTWTIIQCQFAGTTSAHDCGNSYDAGTANATYMGIGGTLATGSNTESEIYCAIPYAATASYLRVRPLNTSISSTSYFRVGSANGNQTVVFSSATGLHTDTTHTDSLSAGNDYDVSGTSPGSYASVFVTLDDGSFAASAVGTAAGAGIASGVGVAGQLSVGTASGAGTATAVSANIGASVGSAAGAGAASGISAPLSSSVGSASGAGSASGVAKAALLSVGTAAGAGFAFGVGVEDEVAIGSAAGSGKAHAAGMMVGRSLPFDIDRAWAIDINGSIIDAVQYDPITDVLRVIYVPPLTIDIGNMPMSITNTIGSSPDPQAYVLGLVASATN